MSVSRIGLRFLYLFIIITICALLLQGNKSNGFKKIIIYLRFLIHYALE